MVLVVLEKVEKWERKKEEEGWWLMEAESEKGEESEKAEESEKGEESGWVKNHPPS